MTSVAAAACDKAAEIIAEALGLAAVARAPIAEEPAEPEPEDEEPAGAGLVAALSEGQTAETGYCIGAAKPYEFEHRAAFECLAVSGADAAARRARVDVALAAAEAAIAADPTLGGLVDYAVLEGADPEDMPHFAALAAVLVLTYTAPNALG